VKLIPILSSTAPLALTHSRKAPDEAWLRRIDVLLVMVREDQLGALEGLPGGAQLVRERARLECKAGGQFAVTLATARPLRTVVGLVAPDATAFKVLSQAARMVREAGTTRPARIGLLAFDGTTTASGTSATEALLAALMAATESRPHAKQSPGPRWQPTHVHASGPGDLATTLAVESAAHLARWLSQLPPNVLNPGSYREALATLAKRHGWRMKVHDEAALRRLGAGAFLAVARGSARRDAALVHLQYRPKGRGAARTAPVALVGKGLCFDTGGHNLKSARSMLTMHADMAGSAVALATLRALTTLEHPYPVDAWLALAENRIGPEAYTQQDVVQAADGTTIQVTHTDAEGRMVLADSIAIASRTKPACIIDFATLTGACITALTERMSGVFTNFSPLRDVLEAAGRDSGERVWTMPMPDDFDEDLESPTADIVQCLLDGKGDHIYASRFLGRFVGAGIPWVHVDLSSAERTGGLAHVPAPITGFGVRFATRLLSDPAFLGALHPAKAR
jgi:leucyl aminopeptidase